MYVKSKDGTYAPAECEIVNKSVINVFNKYIDKPAHVAYAVSSFEVSTNLYAGEFPIAPFCTEFDNGATTAVIRMKPWLDIKNDSEFFIERSFCDTARDAGYKSVYYPSKDSFICCDRTYSITGCSLKITGQGSEFGAYVLSKLGASLDLENYEKFSMAVYNSDQTEVKLVLYYKEENGTKITHTVASQIEKNLDYGWTVHTFDLSGIPGGYIGKMEFAFKHTAGKVPFVNIDNLDIVPKK